MKIGIILLLLCGLLGCASSATPPPKPPVVTVTHMVMIDWDAPTNGDTYVGYNIYRAPGVTTQWIKITPAPINQLDYDDLQVQSGQEYSYYVTSVDAGGAESGPSNMVTTKIPTP